MEVRAAEKRQVARLDDQWPRRSFERARFEPATRRRLLPAAAEDERRHLRVALAELRRRPELHPVPARTAQRSPSRSSSLDSELKFSELCSPSTACARGREALQHGMAWGERLVAPCLLLGTGLSKKAG